jgi:putative cell wall-binding protein
VSVAYVATGQNFPDALAGSAVAARRNAPVLLVTSSTIPSPTATELRRLKPAKIVVLGGWGSIGDGVLIALRSYTAGPVSRIAGADRYATAAAVSRSTFGSGIRVAYVATGEDFPDALAGAPAAASRSGPVLLVRRTTIPGATLAELKRLKPSRIVVLGGNANVARRVFMSLDRFTRGTVTRIAGDDRYDVAANISAAHFPSDTRTVYVATGAIFPDTLSSGAAAGRGPGPVLLVAKDALPSEVKAELRRLDPDRVVVVGGPGAISTGVFKAIEDVLP